MTTKQLIADIDSQIKTLQSVADQEQSQSDKLDTILGMVNSLRPRPPLPIYRMLGCTDMPPAWMMGMRDSMTWYDRQFGTYPWDTMHVQATCQSAIGQGITHIIIDYEQEDYSLPETQAKYIELAKLVQSSGLKCGFYGTPPAQAPYHAVVNLFRRPCQQSTDEFNAWLKISKDQAFMAANANFLPISLYDPYDDIELWYLFAAGMIRVCEELYPDKPVVPLLSPWRSGNHWESEIKDLDKQIDLIRSLRAVGANITGIGIWGGYAGGTHQALPFDGHLYSAGKPTWYGKTHFSILS